MSFINDSQNGPGLEVFLVHPFRLAQFEDLRIAQILQTTLELIQRVRLDRESASDLLFYHLHYLEQTHVITTLFYYLPYSDPRLTHIAHTTKQLLHRGQTMHSSKPQTKGCHSQGLGL